LQPIEESANQVDVSHPVSPRTKTTRDKIRAEGENDASENTEPRTVIMALPVQGALVFFTELRINPS